jgi:hypothetical protein
VENVENLVLEHLRAIRTDVATIKDDVRELKSRLAHVEVGQATSLQHLGHNASMSAQQQLGCDRILERIEKIEKRLELTS